MILTGLLLLWITPLQAQKEWDYQACVNYALTHNLTVRGSMLDVEVQRLSYKRAQHGFLPAVSAIVGYDLRSGRSIDPNTNAIIEREFFSGSYFISGSLPLFNGLRLHRQIGVSKHYLEAERAALQKQKNDIAFKVLELYALHLINKGMAAIQQEQYELSASELRRTREHIKLGLASKSDLYDIEARVAADAFQLTRYGNMAVKSKNDLKRLMNFPVDSVLEIKSIAIEDSLFHEYSPDRLLETVKPNFPQVREMQLRLEAAKREIQITWSSLLPSLGAYAGTGSGYFETSLGADGEVIPFRMQMRNNRQLSYGLTLNIPLFDGFRRQNSLQQAKVRMEQQESRLRAEMQVLEYEARQAVLDRNGAVAEYLSGQKREKSTQAAFLAAERKREKGLISLLEFAEAKNNLGQARGELLRTQLQVFLTEKTIEFYLTGTIID